MADRGWVSLVWPVPSSKTVTQGFGANREEYAQLGWTIGHSGLDIRTRTAAFPSGIGTPVVAARGGTVRQAGEHRYPDGRATGYGIAIELNHPDGTRTLYGHLSRVHVRVGDAVLAGQHIADSGGTGNVSAPHLHFELWKPPFTTPGVWGRVDPTFVMEETRSADDVAARALDQPDAPIESSAYCAIEPYIPEP